jgi:hypothetical protein
MNWTEVVRAKVKFKSPTVKLMPKRSLSGELARDPRALLKDVCTVCMYSTYIQYIHTCSTVHTYSTVPKHVTKTERLFAVPSQAVRSGNR